MIQMMIRISEQCPLSQFSSNLPVTARAESLTHWHHMFLHLFCLIASVATAWGSNSSCRCTSDQSCWPSRAEFQTLASQVSQPLVYPVPPASPCYPPSHPSGNCSTVMSMWHDGNWRASQPGAMEATQAEYYTDSNGTIEACYLNTSLGFPCQQGSVAVIGVDARSPADIQAAIKFALKYNLRLVIKNTGHDYIGRSTAKGSFMIWTHNMKNITFDQTFTAGNSSAIYNNTLTLGCGVQWFEAYAAASANNRVVVGGLSPNGSVGSAGGWVSGGGNSVLSPSYGLGVDNVIQMTIVTAAGSHLTVNNYSYPDLFWALRGGGGGTWGVLTSVTYQTHPNTQVSGVLFQAILTQPNNTNPNATQNVVAEIIRMTPNITQLGFGGTSIFTRQFVFLEVVSPSATLALTNSTFKPLFDYAASQAATGGLTIVNSTTLYPNFEAAYAALDQEEIILNGGEVGSNTEQSSWIFPPYTSPSEPDYLASVLIDLPGTTFLFQGGAVNRISPDAMGIQPAWRNASAYTAISTTWTDGLTSSQINNLTQNFIHDMATLEALYPNSGAYLNQASSYEFDFKTAFFGSHYYKLKNIKNKYDPTGLFIVWEGVGSDDWDSSLNCRVN